MKFCALCKKEIGIDKYFSRKSACPSCKGDLHICLNCRFYSETAHNKCLEPKAEFQRSRDKANFCALSSRMGRHRLRRAGRKRMPGRNSTTSSGNKPEKTLGHEFTRMVTNL